MGKGVTDREVQRKTKKEQERDRDTDGGVVGEKVQGILKKSIGRMS